MGLDMYLYRFPRYKWYGPKNIITFEAYIEWKEGEQKYSFEEWSECSEKDLPNEEDRGYFKDLRKETFADWDEEHSYPRVRCYEYVAYWRKANSVHKWFVDHVQNGEDDCDFHNEVTKKDLEELREACRKILESTVMIKGKVKNGYRLIDGKEVPIY